jgi:competence protein ComEC
MRVSEVSLAALVTLTGCKETRPPQPQVTAGGEIVARRVLAPEAMAMAAIDAEDVELDIYVIDVGQGDSTLIVGPQEDGERFVMLIDAGRSSSASAVEPLLAQAGVTEIDVAIATHYDEDHIGGFTDISGSSVLWETEEVDGEFACQPRLFFPSKAIVDPGPSPGVSNTERQWDLCVAQLTGGTGEPKHIEVTGGNNNLGKTFNLGGGYTAEIVTGGGHVLGHPHAIEGADSKNEMSVAVLVSNPEGFDFLVTGDLIGQPLESGSGPEDAALEKALGQTLKADGVDIEVLRIGHHGAANASEDTFIDDINPEVAIISVGKNGHGHPHNKTLKTLEDHEVLLILQTNAGQRRDGNPPPHVFAACDGSDPTCTETIQVIVNGNIHIEVADNRYDIETMPQSYYFEDDGLQTLFISLECDELGCEGEVE